MELSEDIEKITEFWIGFEFLKKFRETGKKYLDQIKNEIKSDGVENEQRKN